MVTRLKNILDKHNINFLSAVFANKTDYIAYKLLRLLCDHNQQDIIKIIFA